MSKRERLAAIENKVDLLLCKVECLAHALHCMRYDIAKLVEAISAKPTVVGINAEVGEPVVRESPVEGET